MIDRMTPRPKRATLAAVARLAGVAESTASRVLNGYTRNFRVRPEVRQRVLDAAEHLNYKPNPMVRSISAKRTNLVAVVGWASDGVNRTALMEAVGVCNKAGKHVCTTFLTPHTSGHELPSWRVDGALCLQVRQEADVAELEAQRMPYVSINGVCGPHGDSVTFHEADGMEQAVDHLHNLGHERIVFAYIEKDRHIAGGLRHGAVYARRDAYLDAMEQRNLKPLDGFDDFSLDYIDWLRTYVIGQNATAVVAYDDVGACFLVQHANVLGLRIPEDLSITTFNDEMPARMSSPPLTTVKLPAAEAGRRAAELLLRRMNAEEPLESEEIVLKESLVVRKSTAKPRDLAKA